MGKLTLGKKLNDEVINKNQKTVLTDINAKIDRIEIEEKRNVYEKHYKNSDGTFTMELSCLPIHYLNSITNRYEEIDNGLIEIDNYYKVGGNSFDIIFAKDTNNGHLLKLKNYNSELHMSFNCKKDRYNKIINQCNAKHYNKDRLNSTLRYDNIAPNTDLEYKLSSNCVKENIIIHQRQDNYEYEFELSIGKLLPQLSKDNRSIELIDMNNNQIKFIIPSPIMYDSNNLESHEVSYEFESQGEGKLKLIIKASGEWINNIERAFPVYIDPQITVPNVFLPELEIYEIDSSSQQRISSGSISVNYGKKIGVNIPINYLKNFNISNICIHFPTANIPYSVSNYYAISNVKLPNLDYQQFCTTPIFCFYDFSDTFNFTSLYNQWKFSNQEYGTLIFSHDGSPGFVGNCGFPTVTITYTVTYKNPIDYLNAGKNYIQELASGGEVNLAGYSENFEKGILATYIDFSIQKIHQTFMIDGKNYYRYSNKFSNGDLYWLEWNREVKFNIVGDTLYIND